MLNKRVWVAGHNGMVGSALTRQLELRGATVLKSSRQELDLRIQSDVVAWLKKNKPESIIIAAAKVGGIQANDQLPADFIYDNLIIATNVIHSAHLADINRLVFLGSSCIYPRLSPQPIKEEYLLTGPLEPTNEWYALAKIAGIKLCQAYQKQYGRQFISVMPCNLYGPKDNFDLNTSHVIPALIRKFHEAKVDQKPEVVVWGTGRPMREFLYVDDLALGVITCLDKYYGFEHINCGAGQDITIENLSKTIRNIVNYQGELVFDRSKPDGTPRKLMDSSRIRELGWAPSISFEEGLSSCYNWYLENHR